jgi:hypothetical protein
MHACGNATRQVAALDTWPDMSETFVAVEKQYTGGEGVIRILKARDRQDAAKGWFSMHVDDNYWYVLGIICLTAIH